MPQIGPKLFVIVLGCTMFSNCANVALQPEEKPAATGSGTGVVPSSVKVTTSANGVLGYSLQADDDQITLLTNSGWIVQMDWNGVVTVNVESVYFENSACTGRPYILTYGRPVSGKSFYFDGIQYFKPANSPNLANPMPSVSYASRRISGACNAFSGTLSTAVELSNATVAETGLPATITGPIVLQTP